MWLALTDSERSVTLQAMLVYGGGFASKLATAWGHADANNTVKLGMAFPELVEKYGPGSGFYNAVLERA